MDLFDALPIAQPQPRETAPAKAAERGQAEQGKAGAPKSEFAEKLEDVVEAAATKPETDDDVTAEAAPAVAAPVVAPQKTATALTFLAALQQVDQPAAETESSDTVVQAAPVVTAEIVASAPVVVVAPQVAPVVAQAADVATEAAPVAAEAVAEPVEIGQVPPSLEALKAALAEAGLMLTDIKPAAEVAPQIVGAAAAAPVAVAAPKPVAPVTEQKAPKVETGAATPVETDTAAPVQTADAMKAVTKPASATPQAQPAAASQPQAQAQTADTAPAPQASAPDVRSAAPQPATTHAATATPDKLPAAVREAPAAVAQVYTRFIERFDGRAQRFEVSLDPAELGRVDVKIEIGADKKVHAVLAAHDSAALSDLMRGQRTLERALSDAGIDLADNGLSFELSSDTGRSLAEGQQRGHQQSEGELAAWRPFNTIDIPVEQAVVAAPSRPWRNARLDLVA